MASDGGYGDKAYNRSAMYASVMLESIEVELADAAYFTREDLMQLPCFQAVATITRYSYVCQAVRYLLERGKMAKVSATGLILIGKKRQYTQAHTQWEEFIETVTALVPYRGTTFGLMDVLRKWETDQHLTTNLKRVIIRHVFKRLKSQQVIKEVGFYQYERM